MKKLTILTLVCLMVVSLFTGCNGKKDHTEDSRRFKEEYESLNGKQNASGRDYRIIEIDSVNPFIYSDFEEIVSRMKKKETFLVYFGANWCPWCRSVLPTFIELANKAGVDVYYVDVKPDNLAENEKRDVYAVDENGKIYLSHEGTAGYHDFIKLASAVLVDYSRSDVPTLDGTEFAGAKRVGAPNFVLVRKGEAIEMIQGTSSLQSDAYMELTEEILKDVREGFEKFLKDYEDARK